ncbi:hypothetical protein AVEN_1527-1, partial [Araneus ventricosus]
SSLHQEGSVDYTTVNRTEYGNKNIDSFTELRAHAVRPRGNLEVEKGKFASETTNHSEFKQWQLSKPEVVTPRDNLHQEGSVDYTTMNQAEFAAKTIDSVSDIRANIVRPKENLRQEGSVDYTTVNQTEFAAKNIHTMSDIRANIVKPKSSLHQEGSVDYTTVNQTEYGNKNIDSFTELRAHAVKPKGNLELEKGKFASETTNQSEFQNWIQSKSEPFTPKDNLHQKGSVDFTTTSQTEFGIKNIERVSQIRPQTNPKITGKFDGTTTSQMMFQDSPREKVQAIRPQNNLKIEDGSFSSETTNNHEYQQWQYSKPSLVKPHSSMKQEGDMEFSTTSNREFPGKTAEKVSPIRPGASTKLNEGEFEGTTTNQAMFQNKPAERVKGKRPPTNLQLEKGKFADETTTRREFQPRESQRSQPIKPSGNLIQEGTMDFTTSNKADFEAKQITLVESFKPRYTSSPIKAEFDGTTTNKAMFKAQTTERVHDIRPKDNLRLETGEFAGETTNSKEYSYRAAEKVEVVKPKSSLKQEGDIDFTTTNQTQFDKKEINKATPIRPKTLTKASDGKFYSTTTNQAAFQTHTMETTREIRPTDNLQLEKGKMQTPNSYQLNSSLKQGGDMQFETTSKTEFKEKNFDRVQQIRPKTTNKIEGEFEGTTTNQVMFHQHGNVERVKPIRHENNLQLEGGKFANETTNNREFRQWVKMENKTPQNKRKMPAAGVPSEKPEVKKDSGTQKVTTNKEKSEYEAWKLSKESVAANIKESHVVNGHSQSLIENKSETQSQKERMNRSEDLTQTVKSRVNVDISDKSLQKHETDARSSQTVIKKSSEAKQTVRDVSAVKADYGTKQTQKTKAIIPAGNLSSEGEMSFTTTSQTDFSQQAVSRHRSETRQTHVNTSGVAGGKTTRRSGENAKMTISGGNLFNGDMSFETTSKTDFSPVKSVQQKVETKQASSSVKESSVTNQSQKSIEREMVKNAQLFRTEEKKGSPSKSSSSREASQSPQKTPTRTKLYKPEDNLKLEQVPFDATTTTRTEFKKWEGRRSSSKRRTESLKQEGNMAFDTTSSDYSHAAYQTAREAVKAKGKADQKGSLGQGGSMEFQTTANSSFTGNQGSAKTKSLRPRSSFKLGSDDHANETMSSSRSNPEISAGKSQEMLSTSRASYVTHTTSRRSVANRPTTNQKIGEGSFEGQSTTRSTFKSHQGNVEKPRPIKHESHNIFNTENGFMGSTTYRTTFETEKIHQHHCPVLDLQAPKGQFSFNEEKNGHIFYVPKAQA